MDFREKCGATYCILFKVRASCKATLSRSIGIILSSFLWWKGHWRLGILGGTRTHNHPVVWSMWGRNFWKATKSKDERWRHRTTSELIFPTIVEVIIIELNRFWLYVSWLVRVDLELLKRCQAMNKFIWPSMCWCNVVCHLLHEHFGNVINPWRRGSPVMSLLTKILGSLFLWSLCGGSAFGLYFFTTYWMWWSKESHGQSVMCRISHYRSLDIAIY